MVIGIDIGTTELAIAAVDVTNARVLAADSKAHHAVQKSDKQDEHCQSAHMLCELAMEQLGSYEARFGTADAICVTGQMHGIVYMDKHGKPISPLYTWLDHRADRVSAGGISFLQELEQRSGWKLSSGFGFATHYANQESGAVPLQAHSLGSIMDCLSMQLCALTEPYSDPTVAASLGLYHDNPTAAAGFDRNALSALQIKDIALPQIVPTASAIGKRGNGSIIAAPIGDNQASFIGTVAEMDDSLAINIGTSGQVSAAVSTPKKPTEKPAMSEITEASIELRPFIKEYMLAVGSALIGGKAIELFADLWAEAYSYYSGVLPDDKYSFFAKLPDYNDADLRHTAGDALRVQTSFQGTRNNPHQCGTIHGITANNITVAHLTHGVIRGIIEELYQLWQSMRLPAPCRIIGSGGAIHKSRALRQAIANRWQSEVWIPVHTHEAAVGAAMTAAAALGIPWRDVTRIIQYEKIP